MSKAAGHAPRKRTINLVDVLPNIYVFMRGLGRTTKSIIAHHLLWEFVFVAQPAASSPICTHIVRLRQIFAYYVYMQMMVEGKRRKERGGQGKDDGTRGVYVLH